MLYNLFENRDFVSVFAVALLAEGVDRNMQQLSAMQMQQQSPSSRRAWIEIQYESLWQWEDVVALLAEGVDRNEIAVYLGLLVNCRPPRGGRG